jgi:hypothetical protein
MAVLETESNDGWAISTHDDVTQFAIQSDKVRGASPSRREGISVASGGRKRKPRFTALSVWREVVSGLSLRFYFHWAQSLRALVASRLQTQQELWFLNGSLQISHSILAQSPQNSIYGIQRHIQTVLYSEMKKKKKVACHACRLMPCRSL